MRFWVCPGRPRRFSSRCSPSERSFWGGSSCGPRRRRETDAAPLNQRGQSLVGRVFTLEAPIKDGEGRIRVDDSSWRVTGADRFAGAKVRVVRVEGTTLVVDDP